MQCTDINESLRDADFKDEKPLETVKRIKKILEDNGIETTERWNESGVPYCYSLRVTVCGTSFGVNGKGLTPEFALASGYGELMERIQLGYIRRDDSQKDGSDSVTEKKKVLYSAQDLLHRNRKWYENYVKQMKTFTGVQISSEELVNKFSDAQGMVNVTPFFCMNTGTTEYHPSNLRHLIYTANGCAAGNTSEEAIVQAFSEIVERHYHKRILMETIATPEIPDDELKKYSVAYSIITYLRENGFRVLVKDCSLGTKFPVVCVYCIDTKTGRYHEHFGAYPVFEIALERALTESFQGRNIETMAACEDFVYSKASSIPLNELELSFVKGVSKQKPEFFIGQPDHAWNKTCGFSGQSNKELFKECLEFFTEQGYDVLVRDCSCLGFPTYQVLIPGYSEVFTHRLSPEHNVYHYRAMASKVMRNPSTASIEDIFALFLYVDQNKGLDKTLGSMRFSSIAKLAANLTSKEESKYLAATLGYCYYILQNYSIMGEYIQQMLNVCEPSEQEYLICLKRYISMKRLEYTDSQIKALLDMFHRPETIQQLYSCIVEDRNPMERFILHCGEQCDEHCPIKHCCCVQKTDRLASHISQKMDAMDFEDSTEKLKKMLLVL